jgi:pimeloyl-ACP methyl ester carboxylesterase
MPQARANGIDIEYESFGRDGDPLILMIMGLAAQLVFWPESLCKGLADKGFWVVRFDNRDIGKSTHFTDRIAPDFRELFQQVTAGRTPEVPYSLSDMSDDALGLMSALGVERAHIVGGSMGGMIAQLIAINHPERTKSLTSIMSTTGRRDLPQGDPAALAVLSKGPASSHPRRSDRQRRHCPARARRPGLSGKRSRNPRPGRARRRPCAIRSGGGGTAMVGGRRRPSPQFAA